MHPEAREELRVRFKKTVLDIAACTGMTKTCREFGVAKSTFYEWKTRYDREGVKGLHRKKTGSLLQKSPRLLLPFSPILSSFYLRHFSRISWIY